MLKPLARGALLSLALATSALAQAPQNVAPTGTPDDCLKTAFDLAQRAEAKKLSSDELDQVEQLLTAMEDHCDARRFPEAQATAGQIASMIESKPAGDPTSKE